jgi:hypothetical protein
VNPDTPIKFVAQLAHVREVSLRATADLRYWRELLQPLALHPHAAENRAHVLISAVVARFKGLPFRELSIAVATSDDPAGQSHDGYYLPLAFTSSRFFAFAERTCFSAPYRHGHLHVQPAAPAAVHLFGRDSDDDRALLALDMTDHAGRVPHELPDETWQGPIYLPPRRRAPGPCDKFFVARISGFARAWPFEPRYDRLKIAPLPDIPALDHLQFSHLQPHQWLTRDNATHAKSKTCRRA